MRRVPQPAVLAHLDAPYTATLGSAVWADARAALLAGSDRWQYAAARNRFFQPEGCAPVDVLLQRQKDRGRLLEHRWTEEVQPALLAYHEVYGHGDGRVPQSFVVPSEAPWPEACWGTRLGRTVGHMRHSEGIARDKPGRREWMDSIGFTLTEPDLRVLLGDADAPAATGLRDICAGWPTQLECWVSTHPGVVGKIFPRCGRLGRSSPYWLMSAASVLPVV